MDDESQQNLLNLRYSDLNLHLQYVLNLLFISNIMKSKPPVKLSLQKLVLATFMQLLANFGSFFWFSFLHIDCIV